MLNLIEQLEAVLSCEDIHEAVSSYASEIDTLSRILLNANCGNCDNKRIEAYMKLYKNREYLMTNLRAIMERQYELKDGVVLTLPQLGLTVSNLNLTDAIAKQILAYNPAIAGQFKKIPPAVIEEEAKPKQAVKAVRKPARKK